MTVSNRYILHQGPVILGLARTAVQAAKQQLTAKNGQAAAAATVPTPGPVFRRTIKPRPAEMVADYIRHVGGDPAQYRGEMPPHLFPQWALPLSTRTLADIPYPLMRVMNGGCRMELNAPLPVDAPLDVSAQLLSIDDDGRRAVMHQKIVTGTSTDPEALVGHFYAIVPLSNKSSSNKSSSEKNSLDKKSAKKKSAKKLVPDDAREIERWTLAPNAGLDFARLTGDFNPIHWLPLHARAFGFKNVILQGFSTQARAFEGLSRKLAETGDRIAAFDVQFTRPLTLPADVGLFIDAAAAAASDEPKTIYVGKTPGSPAYLVGTFETE